MVWDLPKIQVIQNPSIEKKDELTVEDKIRSTWINAIGGLFFFVTAYFAWKNSEISHKQLLATQEKQITERFSKAVEQLGNEESRTVRLGAIYSLERIAKDSQYDHWTIMEVLTAFIREKSNDNREPDSKIPEDIQAALTVIGRRNTENDLENGKINLSRSNLSGANFSEAKLNKANLNDVELNKANFCYANLIGAYFCNTNLTGTYFTNVNLTGANFLDANLTGTYFTNVNLTRTSFFNANLTYANFNNVNLANADFPKTNLTRAKFFCAKLINSKFQDANLYETQLYKVDIKDAHFIKNPWEPNSIIKNLTIQQILKAKNSDKANYNSGFEEQIQVNLLSLFSEFITEAIF